MNQVVEEMMAILTGDDDLAHYGMPRRSGRYPYGSGEDPYQRNGDFLSRIEELKKNGKNCCLAVIQVGNDPASSVYVSNKKKACEYIGIDSLSYELHQQ